MKIEPVSKAGDRNFLESTAKYQCFYHTSILSIKKLDVNIVYDCYILVVI